MFSHTSTRWLVPVLLLAACGAGLTYNRIAATNSDAAVAAQQAGVASNTAPTTSKRLPMTALPSKEDAEEFPPYWVKLPADNVLPHGLGIEITAGVITGVAREQGDTNDYQILGTRYLPGDLDFTDVTRPLWRYIDLRLKKPDGSIANINVGRPLWWIQETGAKVGSTIDLSMVEVGIEGQAEVLRIAPCDADSREGDRNSNLVIGKIEHENAIVLDLVFNNDTANPLGVTANHPLFSADRDDWVPAGEVKIGEKLLTTSGTATLTSKSQRSGRHKVYNLEVHRSHSYYVSQFGILAHNTGIWTCGKAGSPVKNAFGHWKKHAPEFPELQNAKQYIDKAKSFHSSPPTGSLTKVRPNGEKLIYDPATNTFGAYLPDGTPKTFFRPDPAKHGFPTNLDYFNAQ